MFFGSKLIHNYSTKDKITGALSTPIYQASTFHQEDVDNLGEFEYSRSGNPTRKALEETIAYLEGGERGFAFSSGVAAIASVLSIFQSGDNILVCKDVYGGTYRLGTKFFNRFNLDITFFDTDNLQDLKEKIKENTKAIFIETPSNPLLKITDIKAVIEIAKENNLLVIADNTFMTPYLQRPLELGADIVVNSATKFLNGHSDVLAGCVAVKDKELGDKIYAVQGSFGAVLAPNDSWLLLRGLKTLKVRMDYSQKSAEELARWLSAHPLVEKVYYPGLDEHEGKNIHFSQADGAGCVLSFKTKSVEIAKHFFKNVKLASVAVSLGGVETIVSYPVIMSHASIPKEEREKLGITDNLIRVSLGLEDPRDLIEDFNQALGTVHYF